MKRARSERDAVAEGIGNMIDIVERAQEDNVGDEEEEDLSSRFEPVGLDSRREEHDELGAPQPRSECFGCRFVGERERSAVPYEEVMKFIDQLRKCRTNTKLILLCKDVGRQYEKFRQSVNETLLEGEKPLPPWTPATILDHVRNHTSDPELMLVNMMDDCHELYNKTLHHSVERDQYGNERINERNVKLFMDVAKFKLFVARQDASKMLFYSGGAHVDMKSAANGGFDMSGKKLFKLWK